MNFYLNAKITAKEGSGIVLTNNEIKDINKKVIKSLENTGILLKGTTKKVINQNGGFLVSLMGVGLLLMKNILIPLAKNVCCH